MESPTRNSGIMQRFCLRPSPLAAQAEKLQLGRTSQTVLPLMENKAEDYHSTAGEKSSPECKDGMAEQQQGLNVEQNPFHIGLTNVVKQNTTTSPEEDEKRPGCPPEDFIFGQNLHERVIGLNEDSTANTSVNQTTDGTAESCSFQSNSMTFEQAASGLNDSRSNEDVGENQGKPKKSLSESAEEYQQRQVKRKYSEVEILTGEEGESNVLQINCKLFAFDKTLKTWQERGRGVLRLNDREVDGTLQSRLVMRTQGSLRVILNTKVWSGMCVERPSNKTVRISALDSDGIKVYLIMANNKDGEQLFGGLECRITSLKRNDDSVPRKPDTREYTNCEESPSPKRPCVSSAVAVPSITSDSQAQNNTHD